jgi:hypothetical protein
MANVENITTLIDYLRKLPDENFNMNTWLERGHACGTVGCIGGYTELLFDTGGLLQDIADKLGITPDAADQLCYPDIEERYKSVTRERAIHVLDYLRDTGRVDWSVAGLTPLWEAAE